MKKDDETPELYAKAIIHNQGVRPILQISEMNIYYYYTLCKGLIMKETAFFFSLLLYFIVIIRVIFFWDFTTFLQVQMDYYNEVKLYCFATI